MNPYDIVPFAFATIVVAIAWWRDRAGTDRPGTDAVGCRHHRLARSLPTRRDSALRCCIAAWAVGLGPAFMISLRWRLAALRAALVLCGHGWAGWSANAR